MSTLSQLLMALLLCALLLWQLVSGVALGPWWHPRIARQDNPGTYWFVLAVQVVILVAIIFTGKSWHVRH